MIEGHHGACICATCLSEAYRALLHSRIDDRDGASSARCTLCLEDREEPCRRSAAYPEAVICSRCVRMAAKAMARDADSQWTIPQP